MIYRSVFPGDMFAELDRLQREFQQAFSTEPNIRGMMRGSFPAINIGNTPQSVEIYAFLPGMDPAAIDVNLERGVLTIAGERPDLLANRGEQSNLHINERFAGRFRKVLSLPDDLDPDAVDARYQDGVLRISIKRLQQVQPRRISIQ